MAKFCGKCGAKLDEETGKCPNCDKVIINEIHQTNNSVDTNKQSPAKTNTDATANKELSKKELKAAKKAQKKAIKKVKRKKHVFLRIVAILLCLAILSSGVAGILVYFNIVNIPFITNVVDKFVKKTPQEAYATEIVSAFNNNDMSKINDIILNNNSLGIDDNIGATFEDNETKESNKGVLSIIFGESHLTLIRVENNMFVYEVEAPDMNGVFDNISSVQTQDELIKHIEKYAKDAKHKKSEVSVEFTEKDDSFIADYKTEEFINAITGGLVDEYKGIFTQYMDEIISKG